MSWRAIGGVVVAGVALAGAVSVPAQAQETPGSRPIVANAETNALLPGNPEAERPVGADIRDRLLDDAKTVKEDEAADWQALIAFYEGRADEPFFVGRSGYTAKADALKAEFANAGDYGLNPGDFDVIDLGADASDRPALTHSQRVESEARFALTVLKYARYARGGRITEPAKQLSSYLDRQPQYADPKKLLDDLVTASDAAEVLRGVHPKHTQFEKLRQKYLELKRSADAAEAVVRLPSKGAKLIPGQKHADVALLRKRLNVPVAAGKDGASPDETLYDDDLAAAVAKFQEEKGQKADGIVGAKTRAALNDIDVPNPERLLANMEMWRWMPDQLGDLHVWVNIPEFMVRVVKKGEIIHEERIITGEISKQTPVFSDEMETIYFNPRWNVPQSIKVLELYPSLARGGGSFQRQGLVMMRNGRKISPSSVDWSRADIRNFDVYQPSGPSNALGIVKFTFPNKHAVYLHDTPAKGLFEEASRPFSHGCMRVRNPMRLAEVILAEDKGWSPVQVHEIQKSDADELPVGLDTKIPVHVTYLTELVGEDGSSRSFKDVYGHEQRVKLALAGKFNQIAKGPDHLAPVKLTRVQYAESPDDWGLFFGGGNGLAKPNSKKRYQPNNTSLNDFFNNLFGN